MVRDSFCSGSIFYPLIWVSDIFFTNPKVFLGGSASDGVSDEISRMGSMRVSNGDVIYSFLVRDVQAYRSPNTFSKSLGVCRSAVLRFRRLLLHR